MCKSIPVLSLIALCWFTASQHRGKTIVSSLIHCQVLHFCLSLLLVHGLQKLSFMVKYFCLSLNKSYRFHTTGSTYLNTQLLEISFFVNPFRLCTIASISLQIRNLVFYILQIPRTWLNLSYCKTQSLENSVSLINLYGFAPLAQPLIIIGNLFSLINL